MLPSVTGHRLKGFEEDFEIGDKRVPYEVKVAIVVGTLLFYPILLCVILNGKAAVDYFQNDQSLIIAIMVIVWLVLGQILIAKKVISRAYTPLVMIILPTIVIACASQTQAWTFESQVAALESNDCRSFAQKAQLDSAWKKANELYQNCTKELSTLTGASLAETQKTATIAECPGYTQHLAIYGRDWKYLARLEQHFMCGGWCKPGQPVFTQGFQVQDSCSRAVARVLSENVSLMGLQVTVYSVVLLASTSLALILCPQLLGANAVTK